MPAKKTKVFTYKDKPLFRVGNTLYYGELDQKYLLKLDILETNKLKDIDASTKVKMSLIENSENLETSQVFRQSERTNLFTALDTGEWWLQMALNS